MNKRLLLLLLGAVSFTSFAQQRQFSISEATLGIRSTLAPQNLKQLNWIPGQNAYTTLTGTAKSEALVRTMVPDMKSDTLVRLEDINARLFPKEGLKTLPEIKWVNRKQFYFSTQGHYFIAEEKNGAWQYNKWLSLPENAEHVTVENRS